MKLHHVRDVLAVAECGSLRAAGRHLDIAQPAITRSIRDIERELGISIFERHAKGVTPTPLGKVFLRRAKAIESEMRRATEELEQLKGSSTGNVSAAMSSAAIIALLPKAVDAFRKRYPDAVIKTSQSLFQSAEREILSGNIDFYVGPVDPKISSTQLHLEPLAEFRRVIVARRGHPLQDARSISELAGAGWVRPTLTERSTEVDIDRMVQELGGTPPKILMHASSTLASLVAQLGSDLLTILPEVCLKSPLYENKLQAIRIREELQPSPISLVRRHDLPLTPMAEHLSDMVRRVAIQYARKEQASSVRGQP